jgi:hypothetical protein
MQERMHGDGRHVPVIALLRTGQGRHDQDQQQRDERYFNAQRRMRRET